MEKDLNSIQLDFSSDSMLAMNLSLAFIMFGVALSLKKKNFNELSRSPRAVLTGLTSQFLLLPAFTFLLLWVVKPHPGLALGMILVASCPGGNVSNFFSYVAKGNVALSVTLTAIATIAAVIMTPINFEFWGNLMPATSELLTEIGLDFLELFKSVMLILALPLIFGLIVGNKFPKTTAIIHKPIKYLSFIILAAFIIVAFSKNVEIFAKYFHYVIYLVFAHNLLALLLGYYFAKAMKNKEEDCKTISIETGIQNSGLGLVLIFTFFGGNGPMSILAGWWGIWDIFTGFLVAQVFANRRQILATLRIPIKE